MKVPNRKFIFHLSLSSMATAKSRNRVAVLAIGLTTVLFTTLFTILFSFNEAFQQANFRQAGGYAHASFKYLHWQQVEQLREDPSIRAYGLRQFVGMPAKPPFNKAHVEISYTDNILAQWMYAYPQEGRMPQEGSREAATDTRVLHLLDIEPQIGAPFTLTFIVDGVETTQDFILSGWWEYDPAIVASNLYVPQSRAQSIFNQLGTRGEDGQTGLWGLDVMFANALHIEADLQQVLANHGYQDSDPAQDNYMATGVNWGYTGAQMVELMDTGMMLTLAGLFFLIVCTGYLIIYNVFQISVAGDIRYYGLLKTLGTTARQLRRILRIQGLILSLFGIPLGLLAGYAIGVLLTPVILGRFSGVFAQARSANPLIFVFSALFSLATVLISCHRPGRRAGRVSPMEALRYTESAPGKKIRRRALGPASLPKMARANLGRSRGKLAVTLASLSLALVLLNTVITFTSGFDMDKYLRGRVTDFEVSGAAYFQVNSGWNPEESPSHEALAAIQSQPGITGSGKAYLRNGMVEDFLPESVLRALLEEYMTPEQADFQLKQRLHLPDGRVTSGAQLYGMEPFILDKMIVLQGDLSKIRAQTPGYIAAVVRLDDYQNPKWDTHWAQLGDTVTLRHTQEVEYFNPQTGEVYDQVPENAPWDRRATRYQDVDYQVAALVAIPYPLSARYALQGYYPYILGDQVFQQDTGSDTLLYYAFDTEEESTAAMEAHLRSLTTGAFSYLDYESKAKAVQDFESFRFMFLLLGVVLSSIIGLVGILNFTNGILTGILTRRKEFAVLQSIGMTGRQLKTMLVWEGLYFTLGACLLSLMLILGMTPLLSGTLEEVFWFYSYQFILWPVGAAVPVFALLGMGIPLISYRQMIRQTLIERLRVAES